MPEAPSARLSTSRTDTSETGWTAHDEPPKSDLQLPPSRGSSVCGLKLRPSENHPLRDTLVGKPRPLGSETSKKSRGFRLLMGLSRPFSRLIGPVRARLAKHSDSFFVRSVGEPRTLLALRPSISYCYVYAVEVYSVLHNNHGRVSPEVQFGRQVRLRRSSLRISQEVLAERADLHRTFIGAVERGETNISLRNIVKIARALNLPAAELLETVR
jgi:DNA-binding XRE family transcriptional regulator